MYATLDLIKAQPELARFQFRASNRWIDGAHNRSTIQGFYGAGREDASRAEAFALDAGEPAILLGTNTGPNPVEYLLHALAACLTMSIVYVAAARKVELTSVESTRRGRNGRAWRVRALRRASATGSSASRCRSASTRQGLGGEAARGRRARQASARPSTTSSPTACPSRGGDGRGVRSSSPPAPRPARASWRIAEALARRARRRARPSTTATARIRSRRSTRSRPLATSPRPCRSSSAGWASRPRTTSSWRRAGWRAATRRWRSA